MVQITDTEKISILAASLIDAFGKKALIVARAQAELAPPHCPIGTSWNAVVDKLTVMSAADKDHQ